MNVIPLLVCLTPVGPVALDVLTVDDDGGADFTSLQSAVDAAGNGDTIRVAAGSYAGFHVSGKTLTVAAEDGAFVELLSSSTISGASSARPFVLQGLRLGSDDVPVALSAEQGQALRFEGSSAELRVEDCVFEAGFFTPPFSDVDGRPGLEGSGEALVLVHSTLRGAGAGSESAQSGPGLAWEGSSLVAMDSTLIGGRGTFGGGYPYGTQGGNGGEFDGSLLFLAECRAEGGEGANGIFNACEYGGEGGNGFVHTGGTPRLRASALVAGPGGICSGCGFLTNICSYGGGPPSGIQLISDVPPLQVQGPGPDFTTLRFVGPGAPLSIDTMGLPGDDVWLLLSTEAEVSLDPLHDSPYLVSAGTPMAGPGWIYLGVADSGGWLSASVPPPAGPGGLTEYPVYAQTIHATASTGALRFGPARTITVESPTTTGTLFCFGNGVDPNGCNDCLCGNNAPAGSRGGCANGAGRFARLRAFGTPSLANETLRFDLTGAPAFVSARLASAENALPQMGPCPVGSGVSPSPGLDGMRCVGSALRRHGIRGTDSEGRSINPWGPPSATPPNGFAAQSGFVAGQTRHFQAFVREDPNFACGLGQNSSNAITVQFVP